MLITDYVSGMTRDSNLNPVFSIYTKYFIVPIYIKNLQVNLFINKSICFYHNQIIAPDDFRQFVLLIVLAFCSLCYLFV